MLNKASWSIIIAYGSIHALVDMVCASLVLQAAGENSELIYFGILYNILAFGLQMPIGLLADRIKEPVIISIAGCIILIVSVALKNYSLLPIILAGFGNAMFHVGGGTIALNLLPKKALMPGLFVAPGGIGLTLGILIAKYKFNFNWLFISLLLVACMVMALLKNPEINYKTNKIRIRSIVPLVFLLLMLTIVFRSTIGLAINFPWKSNYFLLLLLTLSIAIGKAAGGFISDKFGWLKSSAISLLISAPLLALGFNNIVFGIAGIFLFNITMPVTLTAISNLLSGRPGFSFGLTTFALIIGALPTFFHYRIFLSQPQIIFLFTLLSCLLVSFGLVFYNRLQKSQYNSE
jgi:hypothetical protein